MHTNDRAKIGITPRTTINRNCTMPVLLGDVIEITTVTDINSEK